MDEFFKYKNSKCWYSIRFKSVDYYIQYVISIYKDVVICKVRVDDNNMVLYFVNIDIKFKRVDNYYGNRCRLFIIINGLMII